jgi:hypothetical protein
MNFYNDIVKYARIARKNNDNVNVYYDKNKKMFYRKSYSGLVFNDMTLEDTIDNSNEIIKLCNYLLRYNNNGVKLKLESLN